MSDSLATECGDYRDPAAPLTIHTLPINPDTLQCPVCGATRGT